MQGVTNPNDFGYDVTDEYMDFEAEGDMPLKAFDFDFYNDFDDDFNEDDLD
eukprot:CAMPEP_0202959586 /NCGR_PEP_ID=MMETSP1396-20130829/3775_1 /ASSEMBLY_ACC=CAM_ASM_000872 /TAXON_ID= /ORGANISM="Pseudokeronopsis sp., Strain Brazil" /LENGTH=50 /DNA_ID=CAMNT_0049678235 /DNA_START=37 /DNA_END=189 /DNA_ORIENTATION=+